MLKIERRLLSEVYLAHVCNNGECEDYCEFVSGVFSTEEKAIEYITKGGFKGRKRHWKAGSSKQPIRYNGMYNENGEYYSAWYTKFNVDEQFDNRCLTLS